MRLPVPQQVTILVEDVLILRIQINILARMLDIINMEDHVRIHIIQISILVRVKTFLGPKAVCL
jgi:hypothetical protein